MKISVVILVYNEIFSLRDVVHRVEAVDYDKEILLIDDCSTDGSRVILEEYKDRDGITSCSKPETGGKVPLCARVLPGDIMEYNPKNYPMILGPNFDNGEQATKASRHVLEVEIEGWRSSVQFKFVAPVGVVV